MTKRQIRSFHTIDMSIVAAARLAMASKIMFPINVASPSAAAGEQIIGYVESVQPVGSAPLRDEHLIFIKVPAGGKNPGT